MWKFCGKAQFPHSFGRIARNYVNTVPFHKISTPGNYVKLRYFSQWLDTTTSLTTCSNKVKNIGILSLAKTEATISHINYWNQVNFWKNLWKFWSGPLCRNKSGPFPLLNVRIYWQSSDTEACAKKLSQMLGNNIDNWVRGTGLRIYVRYCSLKLNIKP